MRVPIDTKDYTNGQEVRALKWNGREIRNGEAPIATSKQTDGTCTLTNLFSIGF